MYTTTGSVQSSFDEEQLIHPDNKYRIPWCVEYIWYVACVVNMLQYYYDVFLAMG
jgi:hypothetical protein